MPKAVTAAVAGTLRPATNPPVHPALDVIADSLGRPYPHLQPPAFPGTLPTVAVAGSPQERAAAGLEPLLHNKMLVKFNGIANKPVKAMFKQAGFRRAQGARWNVVWGACLKPESLAKLHAFQRSNHFPGTWELGRKDRWGLPVLRPLGLCSSSAWRSLLFSEGGSSVCVEFVNGDCRF
jgi:hypothetical protein